MACAQVIVAMVSRGATCTQILLSGLFFICFAGLCRSEKVNWLQEEQDEHGQGKWEGKQKGGQARSLMVAYQVAYYVGAT
jgi:hypothetical protein